MKTVVLVSCTNKKKKGIHKAIDLYDSIWFKKVMQIVNKLGDEWYIISAKHGLLESNEIIKDYNLTLNEMNINDRKKWSEKVLKELLPKVNTGDKVILLAGKYYREFIEKELKRIGVKVESPCSTLTTGRQLEWLDKKRKELSA